jgi:D-3-phosphoglycerate dehydrogenase
MPLVGDTDFKALKTAYRGKELSGKTVGIVGFGAIGQSMAKLCLGMGMHVIFCDPEVDQVTLSWTIGNNIPVSIHLQSTTKEIVLAQSDYISFHLPNQEKPFLDREAFAAVKPGVGIINTARASAIDHQALLQALDRDIVSFAGLDVYEDEPNPKLGILMHPKLSLTPHIGGSTEEAQSRIGIDLAGQIIQKFTPNPIDVS